MDERKYRNKNAGLIEMFAGANMFNKSAFLYVIF